MPFPTRRLQCSLGKRMPRFNIRAKSILLALLCASVIDAKPAATPSPDASPALHDYIARPDDSFAWTVRQRGKLGSGTYAELILTSQTWHDIVWKHQLYIYRPKTVKDASQALLLIDGGSWKDKLAEKPNGKKDESLPEKALVFAALADMVGAPVAILKQVPRQPMFDGRKEDQIIALTFSKFIETGDSDWPLLLPMVKSTVRDGRRTGVYQARMANGHRALYRHRRLQTRLDDVADGRHRPPRQRVRADGHQHAQHA